MPKGQVSKRRRLYKTLLKRHRSDSESSDCDSDLEGPIYCSDDENGETNRLVTTENTSIAEKNENNKNQETLILARVAPDVERASDSIKPSHVSEMANASRDDYNLSHNPGETAAINNETEAINSSHGDGIKPSETHVIPQISRPSIPVSNSTARSIPNIDKYTAHDSCIPVINQPQGGGHHNHHQTAERWLCDICKKKTFDSYDEACKHEKNCDGGNGPSYTIKNKTHHPPITKPATPSPDMNHYEQDPKSPTDTYPLTNKAILFDENRISLLHRFTVNQLQLKKLGNGFLALQCKHCKKTGSSIENNRNKFTEKVFAFTHHHYKACGQLPKSVRQTYAALSSRSKKDTGNTPLHVYLKEVVAHYGIIEITTHTFGSGIVIGHRQRPISMHDIKNQSDTTVTRT